MLKLKNLKTIKLSLITLSFFSAQIFAKEIALCHEDNESFPWILPNEKGLSHIELRLVEKKIPDLKFKIQAMPWKRCLEELKENKFDGAFAASYKADRLQNGTYPGIAVNAKDGAPDESKRLHISEYALYVKKGATVKWDGKKIIGAKKVGAQSGFSILELLKKQKEEKNIEFVDDSAKNSVALLTKVANGNLDAAAVIVMQAEHAIKSNKELSTLEKVTPSLEKKPYFLILSHKFVTDNAELAKKIWDSIAVVRESAEFKDKMKEAFK
nr:hypothetical protein GTC16762_28390 [Pigmentibacter ruber]